MKKLFKINKGFTLVELMVTVGIFVMITGLLIAKYGNFNNGILLTNLAYDVALTIRTAQAYGLNVQSKPTDTLSFSSDFDGIYGVHFEKNTTSFILFADKNGDGIYDPAKEHVSTTNIKGGSKISEVCAASRASCVSRASIDITFKRPEPVAIIKGTSAEGVTEKNNSYAEVTVSSRDGVTKVITVSSIGQIAVK
jgi:prepilin-type N-terminal cleavage/methylation domain-containing protein